MKKYSYTILEWIEITDIEDISYYPPLNEKVMIYVHRPISQFNKKDEKFISQSRLVLMDMGDNTRYTIPERLNWEALFFSFDKYYVKAWAYFDYPKF